MKIGFLTSEYPHPKIVNSGGIGTSIYNLAKGLIDLGHEIELFIYGQKRDETFYENDITFHFIKNVKLKGFSRFLTQKKIEKLVNTSKVEILEAPDWLGITSFIKPNCKVVICLHGSDTYFCHLDNRPVKFLNKYHEKRALQNASAFRSVSQYTATLTNQLFDLKKNFTIIPNSIDVSHFTNTKTETANNIILYFGTLIRKKGLLELPLIFNEVYKNNPNAKLVLIGKDASDIISGNSSTWTMMQTLFSNEALKNVDYLGSVPYEKIKEYICDATICVFPTFAEALPVSWIEAMALGKAVVASNIGWAIEIIDNEENGFLVHPKNHVEFAEKILNLMSNFELRNSLGQNAKQKVVENFSLQVIAKKNQDFYRKVLDQKHD
ncbi:glycosyltransferase family 4 protein [Flavobacterium sp.]|jgi:alpha-maltose-1-phosphate synthase|uniref:glycosyltransferase family 4 protein n=1 Tax=Flavobacterium sp. TaxID=239 RepID=UPI002C56370A|nr:glycosyltransferase family 4 protein [Flavobacterium sp.]HQA73640.1 glycosyltransferase family 4 protein [Flavobacterium sp.]